MAQVITCVTPPPGLVAWWRGENDALDTAGINHGFGYVLGFAPAKVGSGFKFTGSGDDYLALPWNIFPMPVSGQGRVPFSFDIWFKTQVGGVILGQQDVFPFGTPLGGYVPALYVGTNGLLYSQCFWADGAAQIITTNMVNDGQFHHAAVTYDGATQVLYLDGVVAGSGPLVQRGYGTTYLYQLGTGFTGGWEACPGGWFPFTGVLDEASLWDRALTQAEITALYNAGSAGKCVPMARPLLLHRYSFSEPAGALRVGDSATALDAALLFAGPTAPYTNGAPDTSGFTGTGSLNLGGVNGYVAFSPLLLSPLSTATFELWLARPGGQSASAERIFQFGSAMPGTGPSAGPAYLALSTSPTSSNALAFEDTGFATSSVGSETNAFVLAGPTLPAAKTYLAVTYDPVDGLSQLFVNGVKVAEAKTNIIQSLERFSGAGNWLGRSQASSSGFLHAQLDEFRVWEGILPDWRIAQHYSAGPDQPLVVFPPPLVVRRAPAPAMLELRWRADISTGYNLEFSPALLSSQWKPFGSFPTLTNPWYEVTVAPTNRGFFRLRK